MLFIWQDMMHIFDIGLSKFNILLINSIHPFWIAVLLLPLILLVWYAIRLARQYFSEETDKKNIHGLLSYHVSPKILDELLSNPEKINFAGERKDCTFLSAELNGFNRLKDDVSPKELIELLNNYLAEISKIIQQNNGTLDRHDGNIIRAFFGAPLSMENHALQACKTALQLQNMFDETSKKWKEKGFPDLHLRIGICSGAAVAGAVGAGSNAVYTALGESVGLSRKLMNTNKVYGTSILIGESTYFRADGFLVGRQLDLLRVRESRMPIKIFELMSLKEEPLDVSTRESLEYFREGYNLYLEHNWDWAMNKFRQVLQINRDDAPARLYLFRCQEFLENPPETEWDGVYSVKSK